jgi:hypothetical protein
VAAGYSMEKCASAWESSLAAVDAWARRAARYGAIMMSAQITVGGCLCGALRYQAIGTPYNVSHCHCLDCRRAGGAPFVTWASFRRFEFRFIKGQPRDVSWAGRIRSFCATCGTPLTFMTGPEADEIDVTVSTFDRPEAVSPVDHIWVEDRLPWIQMADGLPEHRRERLDDSSADK